MNKARLNIATSKLVGNTGQLDWLPRNPRTWTAGDLERTKRSIERDGDFLEDRPLLAVPAESGKGERYIVFAGNLRLKACKESGVKSAPVVVYFPETDEDRETVKRRAMLDNGSFGSWDYDALANEWDDLPLVDLGIPAWEPEQPDVNPEDFGTEFSLPDGEKEPFRQVSFQLSDEMADVLLLAVKAAQYSEDFMQLTGDEEPQNGNGIASYILAKNWLDGNLARMSDADYDKAKKDAEELRLYLRASLAKSGRTAADVDRALGTNGMSGHYFGASQWLFPTREAYEKMREFMPLPRDWFECKVIEMRYNLFDVFQQYKNGQS